MWGGGWPRTGKSDREAVETATRSAAYHIGTTVLGELLSPWQPVECDSDRRLPPCAATSRGAFREVVRPRSARPETLDRGAVAQARSRQDRGAGESPARVLRAERHTEECGLGFPFPLRKAEACSKDLPRRRRVALRHGIPVDHVVPGRDVVRTPVLVVQVVGVLPDVNAKNRCVAVRDGVILIGPSTR